MFSKRYPLQRQFDSMDCGASSLAMVMMQHGVYRDISEIRNRVGQTRTGVTISDIERAAESYHINALPVSISFGDLYEKAPLPAIVHWRNRHFMVVNKIGKRNVHVSDPAVGHARISNKDFLKGWTDDDGNGVAVLFEPTMDFYSLENNSRNRRDLGIVLSYVKPFKKFVWQLFIGLLLVSSINIAMPFLTIRIVDYGILAKDLGFIYVILLAQLFFLACIICISSVRTWITLHVFKRINYRMVSDYLYKLFQMPVSYFLSKQSGDLLQRIYDHDTIDIFLGEHTTNSLFSILNLVVFGIILAFFDSTLFLVFLFGTLLYFGWISIFLRKRKRIDKDLFDNDSTNTQILLELFNNMEDIIINGSQIRRRKVWQRFQRRMFDTNIDRLSTEEYIHNGSRLINESKNIVIMVIGAVAVVNNEMTLGTLLAIQYILAQTQIPMEQVFNFILKHQEAQLAYSRLSEIHSKPAKNFQAQSIKISNAPDISLQGVSFSYGSQSRFRLNDLNLHFPKNKVTALVGPSGAGKTTVLKLLLKYFPPGGGHILVDNIALQSIGDEYWRTKVAAVLQDGKIYFDSILNNITESVADEPLDRARLLKAIGISNLEKVINSFPKGLETLVGDNGIQLSAGERQRILIARAVYKDAPIMILDEATSALDSKNEREILYGLEEFLRTKTVIVIAHRLSTIKNADKIIVMDSSGNLEEGNHDTLIAKRGKYFNLINKQL